MKAAIIEDLALPRKVNFSRALKFCQIGLYLLEPALMLLCDKTSLEACVEMREKGLAVRF